MADTHILIWWIEKNERLSLAQKRVLRRSEAAPILVSDISLWEIALLTDAGRIRLKRPLREWLEELVAPPHVERVGISPAVASEVAELPSSFHRDPADRILVATARVLGATLITQDERIIDSNLVAVL